MQLLADLSATSPTSAGVTTGKVVSPSGPDVIADLSKYAAINVFATLQGATGGTLDVYLQCSPDEGITWVDWLHFAQLAANAAAVSVQVPMFQPTTAQLVAVGSGTSPALAPASGVGSHPGSRLRVVFTAGTGTTAGATQTIQIFGVDAKSRRR